MSTAASSIETSTGGVYSLPPRAHRQVPEGSLITMMAKVPVSFNGGELKERMYPTPSRSRHGKSRRPEIPGPVSADTLAHKDVGESDADDGRDEAALKANLRLDIKDRTAF